MTVLTVNSDSSYQYQAPDMHVFNVRDFAATIVNGIQSNSADIIAAANAAKEVGGGIVYLPSGRYRAKNLPLYANVHYRGAGKGATTVILEDNANADLFSAQTGMINLSAAGGAGSTGTLYDFSISNMTLDGNKANQTSGPSYPLRFYGFSYILQNLEVRNGFSGGILSDWNSGNNFGIADSVESQWINVKSHDNNGVDVQYGGPHDSQMTNCVFFKNNPGSVPTHNFHICPNASGIQCTNVHCWGPGAGAVALLIESFVSYFTNCVAESSDTLQLAIIGGQCIWLGGHVFGTFGTPTGIKIGQQAGETPFAGQIKQSAGVTIASGSNRNKIVTWVDSCTNAHGSLWIDNDGSGNYVELSSTNTSTDISAPNGFDGTSIYRVNNVQGWGVSSTSPATATGGTIATAGQSVSRVTPTGAITGVILQPGTLLGQKVTVMNRSAFSITFAVPGTSNVADGTSDVIAANSAASYTWDAGGALWYRG